VRVEPIVSTCVKRFPDVVISIDTSKAEVARAALGSGALIVNDIWGFLKDEHLAEACSEFDAGCFLMRNGRAETDEENDGPLFERVVDYWRKSEEVARKSGLESERMVFDPGIGFGTTREEDLEMIRSVARFRERGFNLLVGTSRKRITGELLDLPIDERLETTLATTVAAVQGGADFVRVHDVKENVRVAGMADLIYRER